MFFSLNTLAVLNCVAAAMILLCILNVFNEEYMTENKGEFEEEDLDDDDKAISRRYVEEMIRLASRITVPNRRVSLLNCLCACDQGTSKNPTHFS